MKYKDTELNIRQEETYRSRIYRFNKRTLDLTLAILLCVIIIPVVIIILITYLFEKNKGPILFRQLRVGEAGRLFYIYKFRSMANNAEELLKNDAELYKKYVDNNYKLEPNEDPRITSLGLFLRKTSLDELPQLINVIKGEMSLVGPRPVVEPELKEYGEKTNKFLSVKPGVTGHWQVNGRSNLFYPERVDVELYYVDNRSFYLDIKILLLTLIQVLMKRGAY